jgi:hypothetical protein
MFSVFTFTLIEFLIIFVSALVLVVGLAMFALRRRGEILQDFLTPEEPNLATEFFKKRPELVESPEEGLPAEQQNEEEQIGEWGIQTEN